MRLRDLGNTVLVVEHDRDAILAADHVVDMGPGAGVHGGEIVAAGHAAGADGVDPASITGPWLSRRSASSRSRRKRTPAHQSVRSRSSGRGLTTCATSRAEIPVGALHLRDRRLAAAASRASSSTRFCRRRARSSTTRRRRSANATASRGSTHVDKVVSIDQAPIGRTPRSNPATYTGIFALLRELYAGLPDARARGYKAGRFSFNVKGGRCEACQGDGVLRVEMHFLPDVFVTCDACAGRRYNRETLEVKYRGLSIADALDVTVEQASELFGAVPRIADKLEALRKVGLGYVTLGQPATTLSGGEAQRVKLARELARKATGRTLYVLDEPTTGLHFADIEVLLAALIDLRDQGNTIVVIEHNLDVVACADWVDRPRPRGRRRRRRDRRRGHARANRRHRAVAHGQVPARGPRTDTHARRPASSANPGAIPSSGVVTAHECGSSPRRRARLGSTERRRPSARPEVPRGGRLRSDRARAAGRCGETAPGQL